MINPGVITLASLQNIENSKFPYRFDIEDNIGEAIHFHFKDIRIDLTVKEFCELAESMYKVIDNIVSVNGFSSKDFDPVNLIGISNGLPKLKEIKFRKILLEDIKVDTYDEKGFPIIASLAESRVVKALSGIEEENNQHTVQFNYFAQNDVEKISNKDRILFNLEMIKKNGYPYNNELIMVDSNNQIWDGQHRAACLYYLYGNIEVEVRELVFGETDEYQRIKNASIAEEEYIFFEEEQRKIQREKEFEEEQQKIQREKESVVNSPQKNILRRLKEKFVWQTMKQANETKKEMRQRLENIEKLLVKNTNAN